MIPDNGAAYMNLNVGLNLKLGRKPMTQVDDPISFEVTAGGMTLFAGEASTDASEAAEAIEDARGGSEPAATTVGFGKR